MAYAFINIHIKNTRGLTISNDPEKLNAVFKNAPLLGVVLDAYIVFMKEQHLYAKNLIAFLNKEYNLKTD